MRDWSQKVASPCSRPVFVQACILPGLYSSRPVFVQACILRPWAFVGLGRGVSTQCMGVCPHRELSSLCRSVAHCEPLPSLRHLSFIATRSACVNRHLLLCCLPPALNNDSRVSTAVSRWVSNAVSRRDSNAVSRWLSSSAVAVPLRLLGCLRCASMRKLARSHSSGTPASRTFPSCICVEEY